MGGHKQFVGEGGGSRKGKEKGTKEEKRKGNEKGRKEEKRKEEKRRKMRKKEKEERERKEEKEGVSRSEQTRTAKNPELHYKRYVSSYSSSFHT